MVNSWQEMALVKVSNGTNIHLVEQLELLDAGLIRYADSHREIALTEQGKTILNRVLSPDHASKRY